MSRGYTASIPMSDTVKVMISLPRDLLEKVDVAAEEASLSRSAFIRQALTLRMLHKPDLAKRRRALAALRREFADVKDVDVEAFVRAERDRRY